ncbi:MAG: insecticidal toxin complex protein [Deltaproteobacteria bacterium]|nr:insecticidal toxin complex protein [Deltaproteobacteria bacterium]
MNKETENQKSSSQFLKTDRGKTKSNAIETPSIALPKGGGAIKGIDEKFSVNAVNGTASFSIPLPFSPARGGSPSLGLSYNSGAGNGVFGLGWTLSLPSIKRKTDKRLPQYLDDMDSDTFLFSEAEDLVSEFKKEIDGNLSIDMDGNYIIKEKDSADGIFNIRFYKPRIEGLFARIERWTHKTTGEIKWRVITKENVTTLFGWSTASRIDDPMDANKIFEWLPEFVFDDKGNCSHYIYKKEDDKGFNPSLLHNRNRTENGDITYTNLYLEKVLYGNKTPYKNFNDGYPDETDYLFQTVFDYGEYDTNAPYAKIKDWDFRTDAFSEYKSGFEIRTTRLCKRVLLFHYFTELPNGSALVKSLNFTYDTSSEEDFSFLKFITAYGYIKKPDGTYTNKNLPTIEFGYQKYEWNKDVKYISPDALVHAPAGLNEPLYQFTDLFSEGLSGILTEQANGWYYKHNLSAGEFEQAKLVSPRPSFAGLGRQLQLADLDADGGKQLVSYGSQPRGYFELSDENEWQPFRTFDSLPNIDLSDANTRMLDLNGDGRPEALITEENVFTWYESAGRKGFTEAYKTAKSYDEEKGPHLVFADPKQTIFLADMSGDGMTDIIRIRNGEICYWPNLGYGKFGAKVSMDNAPVFDHPDSFNPAYLRLSDIDGSGTTDIIYLGKNRFSCWKNLSGNRFSSTAFEIDPFPEIHNQSKITVTDLLGNGVACIVWSSNLSKDAAASLKYIDLMNSKKPHIMVFCKNNLGKEVTLEYTPSTRFYIEDKLAGKPWVTKLHFPVHCISKTETRDRISGYRFVSSYKYHHGYYDHAEREFRGFGMVEQTDAEHFDHWVKGNASNIVDKTLHQEPVTTKSWFHTGAFLSRGKILNQFAHEYWYEEMDRQGFAVINHELPLPDARLIAAPGLDASIIDHLSTEEWQEALRACKSMALRSEVFANDAPLVGATQEQLQKELTPYSVAAHNCIIELLQPKGQNKHAIFVVKESEAITYSYERDTKDPRIAHNLNIKLDEYGNVLESAAVVYPRMQANASLPAETQQAQDKTTIICTQNRFTNDVMNDDKYRLRLPSEVKTFELKGVAKAGAFYGVTDFENILSDVKSSEAEYHEIDKPLADGKAQKRLIEHIRNIFYKNDLTGALALHQLESKAIPFESYQLAYTPALIADIFGAKVNAALMLEGKFTHSEGDDNWWIRSGTRQFVEGAETANDAQNRFYVPISYTDPYGAKTKVKYYSDYFLFIEETKDAVGNKASVVEFNFRTLSPQRMKDPNNNISEAITDELGLVKAMAVFGKGNEADDLTGLNEFTTAAEKTQVANFFNAPDSVQLTNLGKNLLQHATARFVYDFDAYNTSGKPVVVASIVREEHFQKNNDSPVQLSFEYSNGLGQVVMKKVQAEPGPAKQVIVNPDDTYTIADINTAALNPKQLRWIGNGRTILNNKGNAVKQYEPYFSVTHQYENLKELVETGVTPLMYYDAMGRLIKTQMPDATFSKTEFDSWKQSIYDPNDTVKESSWYHNRTNRLIDAELIAEGKDPGREKIAADKAAKHANTPNVQHFDTLGRPVLSINHNKNISTEADEFYHTKVKLDIEGNLRNVIDARGNAVMQYKYDMLGNKVYQNSMDAGQGWLLINILGNSLHTWDERNHEFQYFYDVLHRPTQSKVLGGDGTTPLNHVFDRIFYGETEVNPALKNLRGQIVKHYDTGGIIETPEYDFKGQPKSTTRKLFKNYKAVANWINANLVIDLETKSYTFITETDALGRVARQTAPDGSIITPSYNEAGLLDAETVKHPHLANPSPYIKDIDYNEKGQRNKIIYGNDVITRFYYDKETFRLKRLETKRQNNDLLQDWYYTFDPVSNITHIEDKNIPVVFFDNQKITGVSTYTYDALYRLIEATGRENDAALTFDSKDNWNDAPFMHQLNPGDPMAMRNYTQQYQYDGVGNILQMRHQSAGNNWTRDYNYQAINNRLISTQVGVNTYTYPHHPKHGFMTAMPHLEDMGWNFKEELIKTIRQRRTDGGTPETTYYQYDGQGQRIRKITENQADAGSTPTKKEKRIYIAGYELYKKHSGTHAGLQRISLSLMDKQHRFVMIETRNDVDDDTEKHLVRYQLHNHLGSASLELDGTTDAKVISYEEYHPYGTTAYQAKNAVIKSAAKRYRYTGMERDEESGLEYHSARYYLPWLGRWLSCDLLFKENQVTNQNSKTADKEDRKNRDTETMLHSFTYGNKCDDKENPDGNKLPYQYQRENCQLGKTDGQSHKPQQQKNPIASREQTLPNQPGLSNLKNLNLYAYGALNPIIYQDPTGNVPIIQAWWDGYNGASTAGKVGYGFLFIFAYLAHVIVNLIVLVLATVLQPLSFWDFSWGALQTTLGLGIGIVFTLLGADVNPRWGLGAKVEMPAYMGNPGGISFGPVVIGGHGFSDYPHEFGHTWQSRVLGPLYLFIVGIPSLISAASDPASHSSFYTEKWADAWAT